MDLDLRLVAKWIGLGFITVGVIGQIYKGFNYTILGLYILGVLLFLSWVVKK